MSIFIVSKDEISSLNDEQARELIARLCFAEVAKHGYSTKSVTWSGNHRAADGGVDVRVAINSGYIHEYIHSAQTVFQVESVKSFSDSHIRNEMLHNRKIKPILVAIYQQNGAYIIASTKSDFADPTLAARIQTMQSIAAEHGLPNLIVDFYDSQKIADWAEQYPAVVNWLKTVLGTTFSGWQSYAPWAYNENDVQAEYIIDDKVKVHLPDGRKTSINEAINLIRNDISENKSVRIIGLSGVGKTRLVQALFDERIEAVVSALDTNKVFYTDLSHAPAPTPQSMLESLIKENASAIMIVDNCGQKLHSTLTEMLTKSQANIALVTVEYDITDDEPVNTQFYRLDSSSPELIRQLLERKYPHLPSLDLLKISDFSDGNSRVAFALASSTEAKGELAKLKDDELFRRLFTQGKSESEDLMLIASYASLVYSFDYEDELEFLANLAEKSGREFKRGLADLESRGLLQKRGGWRALLPHAIANKLAAQVIEELTAEEIEKEIFNKGPTRLQVSFARRIGYLHESKQAQKWVNKWIAPNGLFAVEKNCFNGKTQIFKNLSPVMPKMALQSIEHFIAQSESDSDFYPEINELGSLLKKIAYDEVLFSRALDALVKLAQPNVGKRYHQSVDNQIQDLFKVRYSGTQAEPAVRFKHLEQWFKSDNQVLHTIAKDCLTVALSPRYDSMVFLTGDFGARSRNLGWHIRDEIDINAWFRPLLKIVTEIGLQKTELGYEVRQIFAQSLRPMFTNLFITKLAAETVRCLAAQAFWSAGWLSVKEAQKTLSANASPEILQLLDDLEGELAPKSEEQQILAFICNDKRYDFDDFDEKYDYKKGYEVAEQLGKKASNLEFINQHLECFCSGKASNRISSFGYGVGRAHKVPDALMDAISNALNSGLVSNPGLAFAGGVLRGWHEFDSESATTYLEQMVSQDNWNQYYPDIERINYQAKAKNVFARLKKSLELGKASIHLYQLWVYFDSNQLTLSEIVELHEYFYKYEIGAEYIADDLSKIIHNSKKLSLDTQQEISDVCASFLSKYQWKKRSQYNDNVIYKLSNIIDAALVNQEIDEVRELAINKYLFVFFSPEAHFGINQDTFLFNFIFSSPNFVLNSIYELLLRFDEDVFNFKSDIDRALNWRHRNTDSKGRVTTETILKWIDGDTEKLKFIAEIFPLFSNKQIVAGNEEGDSLSPLARQVLQMTENQEEVLDIFKSKFTPNGGSGSLAAILRKRVEEFKQLEKVISNEAKTKFNQVVDDVLKYADSHEKQEIERQRKESEKFE